MRGAAECLCPSAHSCSTHRSGDRGGFKKRHTNRSPPITLSEQGPGERRGAPSSHRVFRLRRFILRTVNDCCGRGLNRDMQELFIPLMPAQEPVSKTRVQKLLTPVLYGRENIHLQRPLRYKYPTATSLWRSLALRWADLSSAGTRGPVSAD